MSHPQVVVALEGRREGGHPCWEHFARQMAEVGGGGAGVGRGRHPLQRAGPQQRQRGVEKSQFNTWGSHRGRDRRHGQGSD